MEYTPSESVADKVYSGVASFGRVWAGVSAVLATLFSLILFGVGAFLIYRSYKYAGKVVATVESGSCVPAKVGNQLFDCTLLLSYNTGNVIFPRVYSNVVLQTFASKMYQVGDQVNISYNEGNPAEIVLDNGTDNKQIGMIFVGVGLVILVVYWLWFYLSRKYKPVAALEGILGAEEGFSLLQGATMPGGCSRMDYKSANMCGAS